MMTSVNAQKGLHGDTNIIGYVEFSDTHQSCHQDRKLFLIYDFFFFVDQQFVFKLFVRSFRPKEVQRIDAVKPLLGALWHHCSPKHKQHKVRLIGGIGGNLLTLS